MKVPVRATPVPVAPAAVASRGAVLLSAGTLAGLAGLSLAWRLFPGSEPPPPPDGVGGDAGAMRAGFSAAAALRASEAAYRVLVPPDDTGKDGTDAPPVCTVEHKSVPGQPVRGLTPRSFWFVECRAASPAPSPGSSSPGRAARFSWDGQIGALQSASLESAAPCGEPDAEGVTPKTLDAPGAERAARRVLLGLFPARAWRTESVTGGPCKWRVILRAAGGDGGGGAPGARPTGARLWIDGATGDLHQLRVSP